LAALNFTLGTRSCKTGQGRGGAHQSGQPQFSGSPWDRSAAPQLHQATHSGGKLSALTCSLSSGTIAQLLKNPT
jgi:hypothetical protein